MWLVHHSMRFFSVVAFSLYDENFNSNEMTIIPFSHELFSYFLHQIKNWHKQIISFQLRKTVGTWNEWNLNEYILYKKGRKWRNSLTSTVKVQSPYKRYRQPSYSLPFEIDDLTFEEKKIYNKYPTIIGMHTSDSWRNGNEFSVFPSHREHTQTEQIQSTFSIWKATLAMFPLV